MSVETTALILAWVAIALLGLALSGLLRQIHLLRMGHVRPDFHAGPVVGSPAPELSAEGRWRRPALLLFVERDCSSCEQLLPELEKLAEAESMLDFKILFAGAANGFESSRVDVLDGQVAAFERFRIPATPYGVVVDRGGAVASAAPLGSPSMLHEFVQSARERGTGS